MKVGSNVLPVLQQVSPGKSSFPPRVTHPDADVCPRFRRIKRNDLARNRETTSGFHVMLHVAVFLMEGDVAFDLIMLPHKNNYKTQIVLQTYHEDVE